MLDAARHKSKRDIQRLVAGLAPKPDVAAIVRRIAVTKPLSAAPPDRVKTAAAPAAPNRPSRARAVASVSSLFDVLDAPAAIDASDASGLSVPSTHAQPEPAVPADRYLLRLTISADAHAKLGHARDLLRHSIPNGDLAVIIDRALTVLVEQLERTKIGATPRPRRQSPHKRAANKRHVPAAVKRTVWSRDGGRCTFDGAEGRCRETGHLEFHHVMPYAHGGGTVADNLTLRCHAHNAHDARLVFGNRAPRLSETAP